MRPIALPLLALALSAVPAGAQQRIDRRLAVDPHASIRIFNLAGSTRVTGWDRDSIAVTGAVPRGAGKFFIGGAGSAAKLGVMSDSLGAPGAILEVSVPRGATVWVKSSSADVTLSGVEGDVDISTVSGAIRAEGTPRRLTAEAMDGNIDLTTRATITRAKTAGGSITIHGGGGDITASSVSGSIRYSGAHKVLVGRLETVTGAVTFQGTVMRGGTLSIETHDGPVDLSVPRDQLADFDLTTFGGAVTNALSGGGEPVVPKGKPVRFSSGPGGASVTVRTLKGNVRVGAS
ncbi:MAG: DUF4097 family beta strand repeat-containing protein [Bacillota bacterium]|jgi:hypothetical protein